MSWIDITAPLNASIAEWPGDTPFTYGVVVSKEESGSVNIGKLEMSTHIGTHIDAPFHFDDAGKTVDELDIDRYIGTATVVELTGKDEFTIEDFKDKKIEGSILLVKTTDVLTRTEFPDEVPTLQLEAVAYLKDKGIRLFGVDVPSVDKVDSKDMSVHHELYKHDIMIIENIVLSRVKEGVYDFIGLPLNIEGADGSPVRAVLKERG